MMDKHDRRKTITIKLNGNSQSIENNDSASNAEKSEKAIGVGENHHKIEKDEIADELAAATKESESSDHFDWILPDEDAFAGKWEESEAVQKTPEEKSKNQSIFSSKKSSIRKNKYQFNPSMFFTILFAIVIGTGFGLMMLNLVNAEKGELAGQTAATTPGEAKETSVAGGAESMELPDIKTFVVQGGVFNSSESAAGKKEAYSSKGIPALIKPVNDQQVLFIGLADSIEDAKQVGKQLEGKGAEVFAKEYIAAGGPLENLSAEEKKVLEISPQLFNQLTSSVTAGILSGEISGEAVEQLEAYEARLSEIDDGKIKNKGVISAKDAITKAIQQANAFHSSSDDKALVQLQQHLLTFLFAYQDLAQS